MNFKTGHQVYTWHVLIAPIEEKGVLEMDFPFAKKFEFSIRGLKLNDQEVTTNVGGISLDHIKVFVREDTVIPLKSTFSLSKSECH